MKPILLIIITLATFIGTRAEQRPAEVTSPPVPASAEFAGKTISLDRADMYERMDRELTGLAYSHSTTLLLLKRANKLMPQLRQLLRKNSVPADLAYLACVESSLNPRAYSGAGAAGLWQFLPATAREYGLEVNDFVDERYHTEKATDAACRYFKKALGRYGSNNWETVAASYNAGMGRITRELEGQGASTAYDLYLNDETSRYIFRLLAMKTVLENPARYGFKLSASDLYYPVKTRTVTVDYAIEDLPRWAADHGTTYMWLRELNPWLRAKSLPNKSRKSYKILLPADSKSVSRRHQLSNSPTQSK